MKKLVLVLVLVGAMLVGVSVVNAKNLPSVVAKLPADFKQEIVNQLDYPDFAKENLIEGEVWIKVTLTDNNKVRVVDLSATNPELGEYVKKELSNLYIEDKDISSGNIYYLKVNFDLL